MSVNVICYITCHMINYQRNSRINIIYSQLWGFYFWFPLGNVRDDTLVSGRSFLRGYLSMAFSMHDHAGCKLASDWLLIPSLARKFEPFFHLQLTLGRGNTSRTNFIYFPTLPTTSNTQVGLFRWGLCLHIYS